MTTEKARKEFIRNPGDFADLVPLVFPWVPDSAGKIPIYRPAGNHDYTPALDSASVQADTLLSHVDAAEKYARDSVNKECAALVARLKQQVQRFSAAVDSLRRAYRPPKRDSVPVPYPVRSMAELRQIAQLKTTIADKDAKIASREKTILLMSATLVVVIGIIALRLYLKTQKIPLKNENN